MEELPVIAEDDEVWRAHAHLRHVVDLQALALVRGRLDARLRVLENVVEHPRGDTGAGLRVNVVDELEEPRHALAGRRRDEEDGRVGHIAQIAADVLAHFIHGLAVLLDCIPFIYGDNTRLAEVVGNSGNL